MASPGLLEDLRSPRRPTRRRPAPEAPPFPYRQELQYPDESAGSGMQTRPGSASPGRSFDTSRALKARLLAPFFSPRPFLPQFCLFPSSIAPGVLGVVFSRLEPEGLRRTRKGREVTKICCAHPRLEPHFLFA